LEAFLIIVLKQTVEGIEKIKGQGKITWYLWAFHLKIDATTVIIIPSFHQMFVADSNKIIKALTTDSKKP
jgi:hypothetical protein